LTHDPEALGMRPEVIDEIRQQLEQADGMYDEFRRITGLRLAGFEALTAN
jgi:hypothetical protein